MVHSSGNDVAVLERLSPPADIDAPLRDLARSVVPRLSTWYVVDVVDRGALRPVAVHHRDPARVERVEQLRRRYGYNREYGAGKVVRTGQPDRLTPVTHADLRALAVDEEHLALLQELEVGSVVTVPLRVGGRILGALTLVCSEAGQRHSDQDVDWALALADRAAVAIGHAKLLWQGERLHRMLQHALLPDSLPTIDGVDVAAHYDSAEHAEIGGDFYDVVPTDDGWLVALGDVCGKGPTAASLASLGRQTVRTAAASTSDPAEVLARLNAALVEHESDEAYCTAACAHLVVSDDGARARVATGGHPPPMIARANGSVEQAPSSGMLVGLFEEFDTSPAHVTLRPRDLMLLYTDGLIEARRGADQFGTGRLRHALRRHAGAGAGQTLRGLHESVECFQDRQADDMAMLGLRVEA